MHAQSCQAASVVAMLCLVANPVLACLWDYDTKQMESQQFPNAIDLIVGKFLRHTPEYYKWRVEDRLKKLEKEPQQLALYDDLAVAYDKLGDQRRAIETILKKNTIQPGLYETHANLGTFYLHAGEYDKGIAEIDRALAINAQAHFGREIYQRHLVTYVQRQRRGNSAKLPLEDRIGFGNFGFAAYLRNNDTPEVALASNSIKGVLGIMRFGNYDSPVVLEVLGDLLSFASGDDNKQLAAMAYLKAARESDDATAKATYRAKARFTLESQIEIGSLDVAAVDAELEQSLKNAETWYANLKSDELRWIAEGGDVDEKFAANYYEHPHTTFVEKEQPYRAMYTSRSATMVLVGVLSVIVLLFLLLYLLKSRSQLATNPNKTKPVFK